MTRVWGESLRGWRRPPVAVLLGTWPPGVEGGPQRADVLRRGAAAAADDRDARVEERRDRVGEVVKFGEVLGVVTETTMTFTRIRTPLKAIVTVPNIAVLNGQMINYSIMARSEGIILTTGVTIGYDAPWRTVHALLIEAAARTSGIEKKPAPFVLQTSLNDFYVSYELNAHFEDHAEHEYMEYVREHPELETTPFESDFEKDYGTFASEADLFRQIGLDERQHKLESLERMEQPRFA